LRKLTAIFFLLLFLFNIAGYKGFFFFLTQSADERLAEKIKDGQDLDKELILVKFPFNVPYLSESKDYESMEGEVNVRGTIYNYVKRKIARDTLFLLCVENKEKTLIEKKRADFFNKVNDLDASTGKKSSVKQVKLDYYIKSSELSLNNNYVIDCQSPQTSVTSNILLGHYYLFAPPPESLLS